MVRYVNIRITSKSKTFPFNNVIFHAQYGKCLLIVCPDSKFPDQFIW